MKLRKKVILHFSVTPLIAVVLYTGCTPQKETVKTTTIYLQDLEVTGPLNQSPIHLTDSSETPSITFSPRFSYSTQTSMSGKIPGHSQVNSEGIFQVDTIFNQDGTFGHYQKSPTANIYQYRENNFNWNASAFTAGLDVDIKITRAFALFGGINYTSNNNKTLWGGSFGLGLYGTLEKGWALRLDAGAHLQSIAYDAYTVEDVRISSPSGNEEYVIFYHDVDEPSHINPFINLTINSYNAEWVVNLFLNLGYSSQTLADFEPREPDDSYYDEYHYPYDSYREIVYDLRGESTATYFHFTPGFYFYLKENIRILLGTRFFFETQFKDASAKTFILPMLQLDFTL